MLKSRPFENMHDGFSSLSATLERKINEPNKHQNPHRSQRKEKRAISLLLILRN